MGDDDQSIYAFRGSFPHRSVTAYGAGADPRTAFIGSGVPPGRPVGRGRADRDADSIAVSIADADRWDLVDLIAILSMTHKKVGSSAGHPGAATSPYQAARIAGAPGRIEGCREERVTAVDRAQTAAEANHHIAFSGVTHDFKRLRSF